MWSSPASTPTLFNKLPARPPTPPRDVSKDVDDALRFLEEGHEEPAAKNKEKEQATARARSSTDTPPPKAAAASPQPRDSRGAKRVDFSPWPVYHDISRLGVSSSPDSCGVRQTLISRENKPLKSILKAQSERLPLTPEDLDNTLSYFSPQDPGSFRKMLQSIIQQLSSPSRDARRDAYMAINGILKKYQGVPDVHAIVDKIDFIRQFLARDLAWKDPTGGLDTQVVTQAAQLTCSILTAKDASDALDDDFRSFVVDRCITCLDQPDMPRAILKAHLHIMAVQRFQTSVLTGLRVEKLVNALLKIEARTSTIVARLLIYQRLVEQAPAAMLTKISDWIENMIHAMLSSIPDVQSRAINACATAGLHLGHHQQAAKAIYDLCEKETEDGKSFGDYLNFQLIRLSADPKKAALVPQIWAAVVLFFRNKRRSIDKWPKFRDWLLTMQKCLNSSETEVKQHAAVAWNKLVFTVMPDATTADSLYSMLKVPIAASLEKRGSDKASQEMRQIAMDSYCNLLHYALRPMLSHEELDRAWDTFVHPILSTMTKHGGRGQYSACRILHGFLKKTSGAWNETAAIKKESIKSDDLPRLDFRWVRSRLDKFIRLMEPMVLSGMWQSPDAMKPVNNIWRSLMRAVAEAGSQEVRTSSELKVAIAQLTTFFRRIWYAPTTSPTSPYNSSWIDRYQSLLGDAIELLGSTHFVEDILVKTVGDDIEVAPTPSRRSSKHHLSNCSAFTILFSLYYQPSPSLRSEAMYRDSAVWFLSVLAGARGSASSNLSLLHSTLQYCSEIRNGQTEQLRGQLWGAVAVAAGTTLRIQAFASPQHEAGPPAIAGVVLKHAMNILLEGLCLADSSSECLRELAHLIDLTCTFARHIAGDGGIVLAVVEPLSKLISEKLNLVSLEITLGLYTMLVKHAAWPKNKPELDASRKALWTINLEPPKSQVFESFNHLYGLFNASLQRAYIQTRAVDVDLVGAAVDAMLSTVDFLRKCPHSMTPTATRKFQAGFVPWIEDATRTLFPLIPAIPHELTVPASRLIDLWSALLRVIGAGYTPKDSTLLRALEQLLIAGFSSPSKDIANRTIEFWNDHFAEQSSLEYPTRLLPVLRSRQAQADFIIPGFPRVASKSELAPLPTFAESQVDMSGRRPPFRAQRATSHTWKPPTAENIFIKQHLAAQGLPFDAGAVARATASCSPAPKARLRHNDSEVDFAPIRPLPNSPVIDSQLLTEHQKEVRARQRQDAQVFPEMSSSPLARSASTKDICKKLNLSSDSSENVLGAISITPTGPAEGQPMSDDLPSSPTPRGGASRVRDEIDQASDTGEETDADPPSPPPSQADVPEQVAGQQEGQEDDADDACATASEIATGWRQRRDGTADVKSSDLPSDTQLPNVQLHREEAEAAADATIAPTPSSGAGPAEEQMEDKPESVPKVEKRAVEPEAVPTATASEAVADGSKSTRWTRKRKRAAEAEFTARKKKPQSAFQRINNLISSGFRNSQADEDDGMEDEIVVAPRAGARSAETRAPSPSAQLQEPVASGDQAAELAVQVKGQAGRPRRARSQECAQVAATNVSGTKRSACAMGSGEETTATCSAVEDAAAPRKARKLREVQLSQDALHSQPRHCVGRTRRRSGCVGRAEVADAGDEGAGAGAGAGAGVPTNDDAAAGEQPSAAGGQRTAQPSSILGRLRGILSDCKSMVLGSQVQERQLDDVLFELRREVHDAGRRGWSR